MAVIEKLLNRIEEASLRALIDQQAHRLLDELNACDFRPPDAPDEPAPTADRT